MVVGSSVANERSADDDSVVEEVNKSATGRGVAFNDADGAADDEIIDPTLEEEDGTKANADERMAMQKKRMVIRCNMIEGKSRMSGRVEFTGGGVGESSLKVPRVIISVRRAKAAVTSHKIMADDDTTEETATASAAPASEDDSNGSNLATDLSSLSVAEASIDGSATVIPPVAAPQAQQLPINLPNFANLPDDHPALAIDHPDDFLSLLPPCILPRLERLKSLNEKRNDILEEYRIERAMLEMKFGERMRPLYEERREIVCGELDGAIDNDNNGEQKEKENGEENEETKPEVSSMSVKSLKAELTSYGMSTESFLDRESLVDAVNRARENGEQDNEQQQPAAGGENVKGIPQFWACAMGHVDVIAELITEGEKLMSRLPLF